MQLKVKKTHLGTISRQSQLLDARISRHLRTSVRTGGLGAGRHDGAVWAPSSDRRGHRGPGQLGRAGDLQAGGGRLHRAVLPDGPAAGPEPEGKRCSAAEAARNGREAAELREEAAETETAGEDHPCSWDPRPPR